MQRRTDSSKTFCLARKLAAQKSKHAGWGELVRARDTSAFGYKADLYIPRNTSSKMASATQTTSAPRADFSKHSNVHSHLTNDATKCAMDFCREYPYKISTDEL